MLSLIIFPTFRSIYIVLEQMYEVYEVYSVWSVCSVRCVQCVQCVRCGGRSPLTTKHLQYNHDK